MVGPTLAKPKPTPTDQVKAPRRLLIVAAVLVAAATIVVAGLITKSGSGSVPRLYFPADAAFGIAVPYSSNTAPWSFGSITLCTTKPGHVTITRLTPMGGAGVAFLAAATRPAGHQLFGDSQRSLIQEGFSVPAVVTATCSGDNGPHDELAAQFRNTGSADAVFTKVRVDYLSAGRHESLIIPWTLKLCGPTHRTNATCPLPDLS
jgi:hypothetical protein